MPNNRISLPPISMVSRSSTLALPTILSSFGLWAGFSSFGLLVSARSLKVVPENRRVKATAPTTPRTPNRIKPATDRNFAERLHLFAGRNHPGKTSTTRLPQLDRSAHPNFSRAILAAGTLSVSAIAVIATIHSLSDQLGRFL
jgi:hypothetical protein